MKTKKMVSTAKKRAKIVAMTAAIVSMNHAAYEQAMADMRAEYGTGEDDMCEMVYMDDPFGGFVA